MRKLTDQYYDRQHSEMWMWGSLRLITCALKGVSTNLMSLGSHFPELFRRRWFTRYVTDKTMSNFVISSSVDSIWALVTTHHRPLDDKFPLVPGVGSFVILSTWGLSFPRSIYKLNHWVIIFWIVVIIRINILYAHTDHSSQFGFPFQLLLVIVARWQFIHFSTDLTDFDSSDCFALLLNKHY